MSEIKKCENCGNENIEIINRYKGHYICGKCGRDTERLYEIEHDAGIRAKAIDEFAERLEELFKYESAWGKTEYHQRLVIDISEIYRIAEEMRGAE